MGAYEHGTTYIHLYIQNLTPNQNSNQGLAKLPVFTSAINIFVYIKNAIKRCTALTTAATFFTLAKEFKARFVFLRNIHIYMSTYT